MCSFWNVLILECAQIECAHFGMCPFWNMLFLECALFGMCLCWNMPFFESALCGICSFWIVVKMESADPYMGDNVCARMHCRSLKCIPIFKS